MDRKCKDTTAGKCVSQVVSIISIICEDKRQKRIHPSYATKHEIWLRFIGPMEVFEREIVEAVESRTIEEHPYINGTSYEIIKN